VQLFFVVSAMTLFASWRERGDGAHAFYLRRLFRIAPMFLLAVAFYVAFPYRGAHGDGAAESADLWRIGSTALFINGLSPQTFLGVVPGGWSVADEMLFYVLFPLIATVVATWRRALVLLAAVMPLSLATYSEAGFEALHRVFPGASRDEIRLFAYLGLPNQLVVFGAGIISYFAIKIRPTRASHIIAEFVLAAAVIGLVAQPLFDGGSMPAYALLFGAVAGAMAAGAGRWLVNRAVCHLGRISFSLYLIHFALLAPCAAIASKFVPGGVLWFLVALLLVIVTGGSLATLTFNLVERRGIKAGRLLASRLSERPPPWIAPAERQQLHRRIG
jgi:peptidoglycan/LPS O-acetylase OafA/YrhL